LEGLPDYLPKVEVVTGLWQVLRDAMLTLRQRDSAHADEIHYALSHGLDLEVVVLVSVAL